LNIVILYKGNLRRLSNRW